MGNVSENPTNATVHIVNTNNVYITSFSTETRDAPQLTFLSASTLPWMNEYRDQAELKLLHSILSPEQKKQPEDPKHSANDKDLPAANPKPDIQTPVPPPRRTPSYTRPQHLHAKQGYQVPHP